MRLLYFLLLVCLMGCQPKKEAVNQYNEEHEDMLQPSDSIEDEDNFILDTDATLHYQKLYGRYVHESNTTGFSADLEILPQGNDLSFSISVRQQSCNGQASGSIGMAIHTAREYAGFYDNANCRMEFIFNLNVNTIRVQEIGICSVHEAGCSFGGVYIKKN